MREAYSEANEEAAIKYQLSQLAYEVFVKYLEGVGLDPKYNFKDLSDNMKDAWGEAVFAAIEAAKSKNKTRTHGETISMKQEDNGYLIYAGVRSIMKEHPSLYTYSKFPPMLKDKYRELALKLFHKMDAELEGDGEGGGF